MSYDYWQFREHGTLLTKTQYHLIAVHCHLFIAYLWIARKRESKLTNDKERRQVYNIHTTRNQITTRHVHTIPYYGKKPYLIMCRQYTCLIIMAANVLVKQTTLPVITD